MCKIGGTPGDNSSSYIPTEESEVLESQGNEVKDSMTVS